MNDKNIVRNRSELKKAIRESRLVKIILLRIEHDGHAETEGYDTFEFRPLDYDEESDCFYGLLKAPGSVNENGSDLFIPASVHSQGILGVVSNHSDYS